MAVEAGGRILVVVETDEVLGIIVVVLMVGLKCLYGVVGTVGLTERVMGMMIGGRWVELYVVVATVVVVVELVVGEDSVKRMNQSKLKIPTFQKFITWLNLNSIHQCYKFVIN